MLTKEQRYKLAIACARAKNPENNFPFRVIDFFNYNEVDGLIGILDNIKTIVFAGSNESIDWNANLKVRKKTIGYNEEGRRLRFQRGWNEAYKRNFRIKLQKLFFWRAYSDRRNKIQL